MLRLKNVTKRFGGVVAVSGVSLELNSRGISGLVGPNGSGKTTLFHLITGFYQLDFGEIYYNNMRIDLLSPYLISRLGVTRTFQQTRVLGSMTTLDNLLSSIPNQAGEGLCNVFFKPSKVNSEEAEGLAKAKKVLEMLELDKMATTPAGQLSYGQQRLLELGRVLMADPDLVLLDEPTAGINPTLVRRMANILLQLRDEGKKVFLIEHNMPFVSGVCSEVFVMDAGKIIFHGDPETAKSNRQVIDAYLGRVDDAA